MIAIAQKSTLENNSGDQANGGGSYASKKNDWNFLSNTILITHSIGSVGKYGSAPSLELFNAHKNRMVIEQDSNMLANRISMLQQEEEKIMK